VLKNSSQGSLAALLMLATGGRALGIEIDAERHEKAASRWLHSKENFDGNFN
jgi:hypothetical protein